MWNKKPPLLLQIRSTMCFCFHKYKNPYDLYAKQNGSIFSCKKLPYFQMIHFMRILLWAAYFWIREQSSDRIKTLAIYSEKPKKCQGKWAMEVWSCEFVWLWLRFFFSLLLCGLLFHVDFHHFPCVWHGQARC